MPHSYANVCKNITGANITLGETIPLAHSYVRVSLVIFYMSYAVLYVHTPLLPSDKNYLVLLF